MTTAIEVMPPGAAIVADNRRGKMQAIINLAVNSLNSLNSRRAYQRALDDFMVWYTDQGKRDLSKAVVNEYKAHLQSLDLAPATINQRLSAIRKLATEAADNGLIDPVMAGGIARAKGVATHGVRSGNWLTHNQAAALINSPDPGTLKGLRDKAILALMITCGLRRSEVAALQIEDIQQREGRWVIADLIGKHQHVRTVPVPGMVKAAIDKWHAAAGLTSGAVFVSIRKGGKATGNSITPQAIRDIVHGYSIEIGCPVSAHDLRRTCGKLAAKGGADLRQIQLMYGHLSLQTTERYLGLEQDLNDAPCDYIKLAICD